MQKKTSTKAKTNTRAISMAPTASPTTTTTTMVAPVTTVPTREEIARRAYEIYIARGQAPGREVEDWIQAERELLEKAHRNN